MTLTDDIDALIVTAAGSGAEAAAAARRLADFGAPALEPVVRALRERAGGPTGRLSDALIRLGDDRTLTPAFVDLLDADGSELSRTGHRALARAGAVAPLVERVKDANRRETRRRWAAEALGEMRATGVTRDLNQTLAQTDHAELPWLTIGLGLALAKLGDASGGAALLRESASDDRTVRADAVGALRHAAVPGLFDALSRSLGDASVEVQRNALDALGLLGTRDALDRLVDATDGPSGTVAAVAARRFGEVTGRPFDAGEEVRPSWTAMRDEYDADTTYRLGAPVSLELLIGLLDEPASRMTILEELYILTGRRFGVDSLQSEDEQRSSIEALRVWAREHRDEFPPGRLYKHGTGYDPGVVR